MNINEFKIRYPSLKALAGIQYEDPRQAADGKKIFVEKEAPFMANGNVYNGNYIVYSDNNLPGKYISVHIGNDVNEDTGEVPIHVIAVDPDRSKVVNRMNYRIRRSKIS